MSFWSPNTTAAAYRTYVSAPMKFQGMLDINTEYLHDLLDLPKDVRINNMFIDTARSGIVSIVLDGPTLPLVREGEVIPKVTLAEVRGWDE